MKRLMLLLLATTILAIPMSFAAKKAKKSVELFPDGTEIPEWFRQNEPVDIEKLGKKYVLTD